MALPAQIDPTPFRTDDHGVVRIGPTRVSLDSVIEAFQEGSSAEELLLRYPTLDLADVYATIAYYLRHQEEVDAYLDRYEEEGQAMRRQADAFFNMRALREKLLARRGQS